ncbi:DUF1905 domain-containing protein [Brachybacterium hainanense]|uniref:DUF1905 domain-containing protein n=1 Tax=Brachybacterium hainanense TaxID=1541174 RepID=A0ABV6RA65_9MICO
MDLSFTSTLVSWRGPAPFVFAPMPEDAADEVAAVAHLVTYGWGAIPAAVHLARADAPTSEDGFAYTTSLFPREGTYFVPVKVAVQRATGVDVGDAVRIDLHLEARG